MFSASTFYRKRGMTIHEALNAFEDEEAEDLQSGDIIAHIPNSEVLTDEDSDASEEDTQGDLNHLGRGMLNTKCDFIPHSQVTSDDIGEVCCSTSRSKKLKLSHDEIKWKNYPQIFTMKTEHVPSATLPDEIVKAETEVQVFKLFFSDDFIEHIVSQTNIYAQQKNVSLQLTKDELWVVLGGILLSGYAKYPNKRLYWSTINDTPTIFSDAIRCRRFEIILHHIHLNDNSKLDASDRLYKLRPLLDHLSAKFLEMNNLEENLSVDESMIPYFGRHYAKQYIKGKPIRFGYRNWALCASTGYMYAFDLYMGKNENEAEKSKPKIGFGGEVVLNLITKANIVGNVGHKIYFDNYFTSYSLLKLLSEKGICATGTVRENRLMNCPLPKNKEFSKKEKGSVQYASSECVTAVKYKDNSVVTIASNFHNDVIATTSRYSKKEKKQVSYAQPSTVKLYNSSMGGVDQLDQWVACYRSRMRQKKWWWPIFLYFFDVTVVYSWLLWRKSHQNKVPLLHFRRNLAVTILKMYGTSPSQGKKIKVLQGVRYDGLNHWLEQSSLRRCAYCPGKASFSCSKCDVGLHPKCHKAYHVQE